MKTLPAVAVCGHSMRDVLQTQAISGSLVRNVILLTGISMRLFPRRRRGLLLVVTMTMEAFAMRSEGRTASNFWK
jgi:hypothetical protein